MAKDTNIEPKTRKVRGTGIYQGDEFTFRPTEEGQPSQLNVKTCKGGKTFETTSETKPLKVAHLTCAADAADPYAEYVGQLERLGIKPQKEHKMLHKQRLHSEGGMEIFLNSRQQQLVYQGTIDLSRQRNWQSEVMRQLQIIVRTLPGCEKFTRLISNIKKGGKPNV